MAVDTLVKQKQGELAAEAAGASPASLDWEASDGTDQPRDQRVLFGLAGIGVVALLGLLWARQWLGAGVVLLASIVLLSARRQAVQTHRIRLTDSEVVVDNSSYPYGSLKSWWITESEAGPLLHLEGTGRLGRLHQLPLGETKVDKVRAYLSEHLPEEANRGEHLSYRLARWLRL